MQRKQNKNWKLPTHCIRTAERLTVLTVLTVLAILAVLTVLTVLTVLIVLIVLAIPVFCCSRVPHFAQPNRISTKPKKR
jgi:hypothetical protein